MWFGTAQHMQWIPCPVRGASVGPESWAVGGTLLSGGGYAKHSRGSHRLYNFEWRQSSTRAAAQTVHDYRDGVYGDGLIFFQDPLTLDTNVLPKQWAFPGLSEGRADNPFQWGTTLAGVDVVAGGNAKLPLRGVRVPLPTTRAGRVERDELYVPIPEGHTLRFAAWYATASSTAGVYLYPVTHSGGVGAAVRVTPSAPTSVAPTGTTVSSTTHRGVYVSIERTAGAATTVDLYGMRAVLYPTGSVVSTVQGWVGGQGNSGCRFVTHPTYVENTGVGGGQVSFAASFREVGDWL